MNRATNSLSMKENNKKLILRLIRAGEYSRADIAKMTGLTKAAVTIIVDELIGEHIVLEKESEYNGVGRRPIHLSVNHNIRYAVGLNITRKYYEAGIVNLAGEVITGERKELRSQKPGEVLTDVTQMIREQIKRADIDEGCILGIGITTPGPVDYLNHMILTPPKFEEWHNFRFDALGEQFPFLFALENISNAYALCEKYFGVCVSENNYITVSVDEGIGAGIVVNGKIYRGSSGLGNEIGHISIDYNGRQCECGNVGCLEKYASIPEILEETPFQSWREVIDANAEELISREAVYLAAALTGVINLFDLNMVVLGGDLRYQGEKIAGLVRKSLKERVITKKEIPVIAAKRREGVLIAGTIMINAFFN